VDHPTTGLPLNAERETASGRGARAEGVRFETAPRDPSS
jgi:hypothetical protein